MRSAALFSVFVVLGYAANAQLTFLPQAGLEKPRTKMSYNGLSYFSPLQSQLAAQLGIRLDYKFKNRYGPFIGLYTSSSTVSYNFSDPETGMTNYRASAGNLQLQLQAGLQWNTKPIYFNKSSASKKLSAVPQQKSTAKKSCGNYLARNYCSRKKENTQIIKRSPDKSWNIRIQPSAGFAFMPSNQPDVLSKSESNQTTYIYNAGNRNFALITGVGFEFGQKSSRYFTVSFNYFKGIGTDKSSLTTQTGVKSTVTQLHSKVSGWNASIGIPFSINKKPVAKEKTFQKTGKYNCEQYRSRCKRTI